MFSRLFNHLSEMAYKIVVSGHVPTKHLLALISWLLTKLACTFDNLDLHPLAQIWSLFAL